jgi:serine protease
MKKITSLLAAGIFSVSLLLASNGNLPKPTQKFFKMPENVTSEDYIAKNIILKVKSQYRNDCQANGINNNLNLNMLLQQISATSLEKMFPRHKAPEREKNDMGLKMADISLIYALKYEGNFNEEMVINWLLSLGIFEYVQPYYLPKIYFTPNDPNFGSQSHLGVNRIDAVNGWNISQGSTTVTIGITDTGVELNHPDLQNNIQYNLADPINGIDDDGDGYLDNYRGWDVAMNDNDTTWQANAHGVHVSGCSSASTNNSIGVAGSGFNCRFLPVKISNASGSLVAAYQGIVYAADHGCHVINCSWGGTGGGPFEQNIIDYATINKNALVIAAAGNNSQDQAFFPAALNYVISVASTGSVNDIKSGFSNWNYTVDVSAPGSSILATWSGGGYSTQSGTSMACPVAAGVCGMIKSVFTSYNALQIGERLKATTDPIYQIPQNGSYVNKLGTGRVDMFNALNNANAKSVLLLNRVITDNNDNIFIIGDTIRIHGDYTCMLAPVTSATTATLSTSSSFVSILSNSFPVGALNTLASVNSASNPFRVRILPTCPLNQPIDFTLTIQDGSWTYLQFFTITVNVDYINITVNDIKTTITSRGRIGYNQDGQQQGLGFQYLDSNLMYESSFMIGNSSTKVSDMFRGGATGDNDNSTILRVYQVTPAQVSAFDVTGVFADALNPSGPIGIQTRHKGWAWTTAGNRKYVIVEYVMKNTNASPVSNLYAGIISDWDVMNYAVNKANQNAAIRLGYVYSTQTNGLYAGTKLLTTTAPFVHYAVDNIAGGGGGVDPTAGTPAFDTGEKFTVLSTNRAQAGVAGNGNDVMDCVSSGPFTIAPGDSVVVAFALLAGDNLTDITTSAGNAQITYDGILTGASLIQQAQQLTIGVFPNPANGLMYLNINIPETGPSEVGIFNLVGQEVISVHKGSLPSGKHLFEVPTNELPNGVYYIRVINDGKNTTNKVVISH